MIDRIKAFSIKFQELVNRIILFLCYFLVLGPISIYVRLIKHEKLPNFLVNASSAWSDIPSRNLCKEEFSKQH